jgi:S-adenosylmethionine:tRNA ribosyltransferase-isomerase
VGAIAAPTAGLHFTHDLLERLDRKGVMRARVTLHVGYGTFSPVRVTDIRDHAIHAEYVAVPPETAEAVNAVLARGGRLWVVGTTTARALEFAATGPGRIAPRQGLCDLYIVPGYRFQVVRNLITNFHLPKSSLLFMVCALAGRDRVMAAYDHALRAGFRFYSYGDAMVLAGDQTMGLEQGGEK